MPIFVFISNIDKLDRLTSILEEDVMRHGGGGPGATGSEQQQISNKMDALLGMVTSLQEQVGGIVTHVDKLDRLTSIARGNH